MEPPKRRMDEMMEDDDDDEGDDEATEQPGRKLAVVCVPGYFGGESEDFRTLPHAKKDWKIRRI